MTLVPRALAGLCDWMIAPAYSAPGYWLRRKTWSAASLELDLSGKEYLVTGANSGLGYASVEALAARGARVLMVCRDRERGEAAMVAIAGAHPRGSLDVVLADVAELEDVRALCQDLRGRLSGLDGLIHNAGVMLTDRELTRGGHERCFATNVLGPFLMTHELAPLLEERQGRVVVVSSGGMYTQKLAVDDLEYRREPYDGVLAYAQTKRAEVILTELWAAFFRARGITVNSMHPGWADTPGVRRSLPRFYKLTRSFLRDARAGADTIVWLAIAAEVAGASGGFYFDRVARRTHGPFARTRSSKEDRARLWEECRRLCGISEEMESRGETGLSKGLRELE